MRIKRGFGHDITERFLRMPSEFFEGDSPCRRMSLWAKTAYMLLFERLKLSDANAGEYSDPNGDLFVIYTREEMAERLDIGERKASDVFRELEAQGLIESVRRGGNQPNKIYLIRPSDARAVGRAENAPPPPENGRAEFAPPTVENGRAEFAPPPREAAPRNASEGRAENAPPPMDVQNRANGRAKSCKLDVQNLHTSQSDRNRVSESERGGAGVRACASEPADPFEVDNPELKAELLRFAAYRDKRNVPNDRHAKALLMDTLRQLEPTDVATQLRIVRQSLRRGWLDFSPLEPSGRDTHDRANNDSRRRGQWGRRDARGGWDESDEDPEERRRRIEAKFS